MSSTRRQWLRCAVGAGAALGSGLALAATGLQWRERALLGFGTTLWLRAGHVDGARADAALDAAVARLRHLESQCSLFNSASALCRLNRDGRLDDPDPALVDLLQQAQVVSARCGGAFDVTVQPLWAAWQQASAADRVPTPTELAAAQARVDWRALQVSARRIGLARPGMALWRERLFSWMLRNAASAMEFFRLPTNRVVELGSQIEI